MIGRSQKPLFLKSFRTLETALAAEQTKVTTLETTVAASTTKITTLETALAASTTKITTLETALTDLTARFDNINSACLDDGARRLASAPCGGIKAPTMNDDSTDTGSTSNTDTSTPTTKADQVLVQSLRFTGVQASALSSTSARKNLESKIAKALGIDATRVTIRQIRLLADGTGVEIVYEITIEGDTAALTAKGVEMSKQDSVVYTAVVEAVAIEAGVDASSVTMTSTPMEEAAPSVSNELPSSGGTDTTDTTDNANEMTIIIASSAGGGSILLAMIVVYFCRRAKKQNVVVDDVKMIELQMTELQKENEDLRTCRQVWGLELRQVQDLEL